MQPATIVELNEQNLLQVLESSKDFPCAHPFLGTNE